MHVALTIFLVLHATIHLAGFLKWSKLAEVPQLTGRTIVSMSPPSERVFAFLWLAAMIALLTAAALRFARPELWWPWALVGASLSQGLIVVAWPDARFGSVANLVIVLAALMAAADARFTRRTDAEVRSLVATASASPATTVTRADAEHLPLPVRRWLEASGVVGRPRARTVHLRQRGKLRVSPESAWMPASAEQYFSVDPPGFVWKVEATMMGALPITGRDRYAAGHGHMLIKAAALIDVVDAADEKIDQGSMLRFLAEMIWFPSGALAPYVTWEPIDEVRAKATMRQGGVTASAVFTFSVEGRFLRLEAERYMGAGGEAKLTPWTASSSDWRAFQGIEVPTRGVVGWTLPTGEFPYYEWEIMELDHDDAT